MNDTQLSSGRRGGHRELTRLLVILGFVAVSLVLLEGFAYLVFRVTGLEPYKPPVIVNPHHPYLGWMHAPNVVINAGNCNGSTSSIRTDADGYSITPYYDFSSPDIRIVVTGASAIFGIGTSGNDSTVASILERLIVEETGIRAEVYNIAVRGYQSFQEMLSLLRFSTQYDFDLALAIGGHNDSDNAAQEQNRQSALLPGNPHRASNFVRRAEREEFILRGTVSALRSCCRIFDLLAHFADLDDTSGRAHTPGRLPSSKRRPENPSYTDVSQRAAITLMNYALMDQISRQKGAEFVMILQPTLYTQSTGPYTGQENGCLDTNPSAAMKAFKKEYQQRFYKAYLEQDKTFGFIDARGAFDTGAKEDTYFIDEGHYNNRGAEKLARYIFERIRPLVMTISARHKTMARERAPQEPQPPPGLIIHGEDVLAGRAPAAESP